MSGSSSKGSRFGSTKARGKVAQRSGAPWAGAAIEGPAAECAAAEVSESASGWQANITKRVTVESLSTDATCQSDGQGLSAGTAVVKLRTFYDIPFQDWEVTSEGATSNYSLPMPSAS